MLRRALVRDPNSASPGGARHLLCKLITAMTELMTTTNSRRTIFITNPHAGHGATPRTDIERFCQLLRQRGIEVEVTHTAGPRDASRLAAEAARAGAREIVVRGGDGTVHEAIQGLVGTGARLAVWPAGTANVLARQLGLPFDATRAAAAFAAGQTRRLSLGRATAETTGERRYFFLMAGVGLDASVVRHVRPGLKRRVGEAAYWYSGLGHLAHWRPREFTVEVGGESLQATYAAIGKAPWYGGGLKITPRARLDAPEFEVCLINSHSRLRYLYLLTDAVRGAWADDRRDVRFIRASRLRVAGDADVQADGELIGRLPMTFEMIPDALEIIVPPPPV